MWVFQRHKFKSNDLLSIRFPVTWILERSEFWTKIQHRVQVTSEWLVSKTSKLYRIIHSREERKVMKRHFIKILQPRNCWKEKSFFLFVRTSLLSSSWCFHVRLALLSLSSSSSSFHSHWTFSPSLPSGLPDFCPNTFSKAHLLFGRRKETKGKGTREKRKEHVERKGKKQRGRNM